MRERMTIFLEILSFPEFKNSEMTWELTGIKTGISDGRQWLITTIVITIQSYFGPRLLQNTSNSIRVAF